MAQESQPIWNEAGYFARCLRNSPFSLSVRLAAPPSTTFYHSRYSNQNTRADKCNDYGTYHPATRAQPKQTEYPATHESTENSQNNVSDNPVAAALHH